MSYDVWTDYDRQLSGNANDCCLCLSPNYNKTFALINSNSDILHNGVKYSYRQIVDECFRIKTAPSTTFVVCDECRRLLERTFTFFLQIKNAQSTLRTNAGNSIKVQIEVIKAEPDIGSFIVEDSNADDGAACSTVPHIDDNVFEDFKENIVSDDEKSLKPPKKGHDKKISSTSKKRTVTENKPPTKINYMKCTACTQKFTRLTVIRQHISEEHGDEALKFFENERSKKACVKSRFPCNTCSEKFPKINDLKMHISQKHGVEALQSIESKLTSARKKHSAKRINYVKCTSCSQKFVGVSVVRQHISEEHGDEALKFFENKRSTLCGFKCAHCSERFPKLSLLKKHIAHKHENEYPKQKIYKSDRETSRFMYGFKGDELSCGICDETFPLHALLVKHMNVHYPNHVCDSCGKAFAREQSLKLHIGQVHPAQLAACDLCDKTYKTLSALRHHKGAAHGVGDANPRTCPECPARFPTNYARLKHMHAAHGVPFAVYACKLCPRRFKLSGELVGHVNRTHLQIKRRTCEECGYRAFDKRAYDEHAAVHTGVRKYACDACGKRFGARNSFIKHVKTHRK